MMRNIIIACIVVVVLSCISAAAASSSSSASSPDAAASAKVHNRKGKALAKAGDYEEAVVYFRRSVDAVEGSSGKRAASYANDLAVALLRLGAYDEAKTVLLKNVKTAKGAARERIQRNLAIANEKLATKDADDESTTAAVAHAAAAAAVDADGDGDSGNGVVTLADVDGSISFESRRTVILEDVSMTYIVPEKYQDVLEDEKKKLKVKGWFILFHGCSQKADQWFTQPEETLMVRHILSRKMGVIAVQQKDDCWERTWPPSKNDEVVRVVRGLTALISQLRITKKATFSAIGASSGGDFVSILTRVLKFQYIVLQVAPGVPEAFDFVGQRVNVKTFKKIVQDVADTYTPPGNNKSPTLKLSIAADAFPHISVVYMPKDTTYATEAILQQRNDDMREEAIPIMMLPCSHRPLSPLTLHQRITGISKAWSQRYFDTAVKEGFVSDTAPHYIKENPRNTDMASKIISSIGEIDDESADGGNGITAITQQMNVLWGEHEVTSQHIRGIVDTAEIVWSLRGRGL